MISAKHGINQNTQNLFIHITFLKVKGQRHINIKVVGGHFDCDHTRQAQDLATSSLCTIVAQMKRRNATVGIIVQTVMGKIACQRNHKFKTAFRQQQRLSQTVLTLRLKTGVVLVKSITIITDNTSVLVRLEGSVGDCVHCFCFQTRVDEALH